MPPRSRIRVTAPPDPWTHHGDLLAYARRMLGDEGRHAEDVVQDAYLRLTERAAMGLVPDDDRSWLFRVVRNLALDERRRARHATPVSDPDRGAEAGSAPADVLERREALQRTLEDVADLPPRERRALVLDQAGLPTVEIARRMSTSQNAVHQALFRARRRLRSARSAAWGVLPLPVARLMLRAGDARLPEMLVAAGTPGGGRLVPVAGVVGAAVVGLLGGGAVVHELAEPPEVIRTERTGLLSAASVVPAVTAPARRAAASGTRSRRVVAATPRTRPAAVRRTPAALRPRTALSVRRRIVVVPRAIAAAPAPAPAPRPVAPARAGGGHHRHDGDHTRRRGDGEHHRGHTGGTSRRHDGDDDGNRRNAGESHHRASGGRSQEGTARRREGGGDHDGRGNHDAGGNHGGGGNHDGGRHRDEDHSGD